MGEYIKREDALKIIDNYSKAVTEEGMVVVNAIRDIIAVITPAADVVPNSEVELPPELPTEVRNEVNERARKAVQKLYEKAYQDAIEYPENYGDIFEGYENNLPTALALINWQKMEIESLTINMNAYGLAAKRLAEQKTEVAREIFEEIEKTVFADIDFFKELKKKYTENCTTCKHLVSCEPNPFGTCNEYDKGERNDVG